MAATVLREKLLRLRELTLRERECCKAANLEGLHEVIEQKKLLLCDLESLEGPVANSELRKLADGIREENRRNAYLLWASLRFIRESMAFFGRQSGPASYSATGSMIHSGGSGLVLSGRV